MQHDQMLVSPVTRPSECPKSPTLSSLEMFFPEVSPVILLVLEGEECNILSPVYI